MAIALLLAAGQARPLGGLDELRWRRFVHSAVAAETPFDTRMTRLRRLVGQLGTGRLPNPAPGVPGPSGLQERRFLSPRRNFMRAPDM